MHAENSLFCEPPPLRHLRALLTAFGVIWMINAAFQVSGWLLGSDAGVHFVHALAKSASVVPAWVQPLLVAGVQGTQAIGPGVVVAVMVLVDVLLGLALLTQRHLVPAAVLGMGYSLLSWVFLDGLGFPYGNGQTDPGVFVAYAIAFVFVLAVAPMFALRQPVRTPDLRWWKVGRIAFGLLWLFDAVLKWLPGFLLHFTSQITSVIAGQPHWVAVWLGLVAAIIHTVGPVPVAVLTALAETVIALGLLGGKGLRPVLAFGVLYSIAVWCTAEAFGGPYTLAGSGVRGNVVGNVVIYLIPFLFLWQGSRTLARSQETGA